MSSNSWTWQNRNPHGNNCNCTNAPLPHERCPCLTLQPRISTDDWKFLHCASRLNTGSCISAYEHKGCRGIDIVLRLGASHCTRHDAHHQWCEDARAHCGSSVRACVCARARVFVLQHNVRAVVLSSSWSVVGGDDGYSRNRHPSAHRCGCSTRDTPRVADNYNGRLWRNIQVMRLMDKLIRAIYWKSIWVLMFSLRRVLYRCNFCRINLHAKWTQCHSNAKLIYFMWFIL